MACSRSPCALPALSREAGAGRTMLAAGQSRSRAGPNRAGGLRRGWQRSGQSGAFYALAALGVLVDGVAEKVVDVDGRETEFFG